MRDTIKAEIEITTGIHHFKNAETKPYIAARPGAVVL